MGRWSSSPLWRALGELALMGRPHWRVLAASWVCMVLVAVTTGAYAWLMGPALRFLLTGGRDGLGLVAEVWPEVTSWPVEKVLLALPVAVVVIGGVKAVGYLGQFYLVGVFGQRVVIDLRRRLFSRYCALTPQQRSTRLAGDLLSRFTADVAAVELAATYTVASWLRDTLQIVVLVVAAFVVSWQLSLVALVVVPLAVWPTSRLTRSLFSRSRESQASLGALAGQVQEGLGALRTVQAFNAERVELRRFAGQAGRVEAALTRAGWSRAAVPGLMEVLASAAIAGAMAWAATHHAVSPDALVSFLGALVLLYQPAKDLGRVSQFAVQAASALERLHEVLALPPVTARQARPGVDLPRFAHSVELRDLHFSWGSRAALRGVTFTLRSGEVTALVGPSGSGKSTLASLLLGFEAPTRGAVVIDGVDTQGATLASVRRQFALVTQDALLFASSVRDNLLVARPDATDDELEAAATVAQAKPFIDALPQGWLTLVGERGVTLSGGQKQRLCLARAVLAQAPILVLDEATSNLDTESEREVLAALDQVLRGRTALVIAHRLATVAQAHRVVVLDEGRVVEEGTHRELLEANGTYARLWRQQHP